MKSLTLLLLAGLAVAAQEGGAEAAAGNATDVAQAGNGAEAAQGGEANADAGKDNNNNQDNNQEDNNNQEDQNQENNANDVIQVQNGQQCVNLDALNDPKCVFTLRFPYILYIRLTPLSTTASTQPRSTWATCRSTAA